MAGLNFQRPCRISSYEISVSGAGCSTLVIHQEDGVEDLHGGMGIQGGGDLGDPAQVAVDEFAQAAVVFHCAHAGATADEQLKTGDAEGVLHIDGDQSDLLSYPESRGEIELAAHSSA